MDRGAGVDHVHLEEAVVGVEGQGTADAPIGGELDTLVGEGADVAVLRLAVLTHNFDDVGTLGVEEAQLRIEGSAKEMLAEGQVIAPGLLGEEFRVGGSVHVKLTHVRHAETFGSGGLDGGVVSRPIGKTDLRDPLSAIRAMIVETDARIEHEAAKDLLVKHIDRLFV